MVSTKASQSNKKAAVPDYSHFIQVVSCLQTLACRRHRSRTKYLKYPQMTPQHRLGIAQIARYGNYQKLTSAPWAPCNSSLSCTGKYGELISPISQDPRPEPGIENTSGEAGRVGRAESQIFSSGNTFAVLVDQHQFATKPSLKFLQVSRNLCLDILQLFATQ